MQIVGTEILAEEGNARWISKVKSLSVFTKVLRTSHQPTHLLKNCDGSSGNLIPSTLQAMNRIGAECGDDRC
jgi:hypothetical protein